MKRILWHKIRMVATESNDATARMGLVYKTKHEFEKSYFRPRPQLFKCKLLTIEMFTSINCNGVITCKFHAKQAYRG